MCLYKNIILDWAENPIHTELITNDVTSTMNGSKFDRNKIDNLETPKGKL